MVIVAALVALAWTAMAIRLLILIRSPWFRFLGPAEVVTDHAPTVDAVVPARNEEAHVAATVAALRAQRFPNLTITVIDDQSTDATAAILDRLANESGSSHPLRFVRGVERPEGWVGKTWAVHQGARQSSTEWLWFVDADMGLHPDALATAVHEATKAGADLVSFLPGVRCETFWQGTIAASFVQILAQLYPLDRVNDPARPEAIAAGGFILVRRSSYEAAGGHEAVRRAIIEDVQIARAIKANGGKLLVRLAPTLAWTHMYGSFGDIWRGLRKNAYAGMDYLPHKFVTGAILGLMLAWAPWVAAATGLVTGSTAVVAVGAWGILAQASATAPLLVFLGLPASFAFTLPAGISAYVAIASSSVWHYHRGRILWKGRAIPTATVAIPLETENRPIA